ACRFADHVITVSDHWRETLVHRGVDRRKCSVVMNVADTAIFRPVAAARRDSERFELVYHGTVTYRYGLDLALAAIAELAHDIPEIHLTVLGRGDLMPDLVAQRDALGLAGHVDLCDDYVIAEQLPEKLVHATLGVVPYRDDVFTDGIVPTKLMEYAALGLPCVASRTSAIQAYFEGCMTELVTPDDVPELAARIRDLAADPRRRDELSRLSTRFTERYNWRQVSADYARLVERLGLDRLGIPVTSSRRGNPPAPRSRRRGSRPGRTRGAARAPRVLA
ncbi:MAG TPA: glycosyltransferase, partial [Acidimicrobiia bacterium]|nr:glycosyltransferase [Acidimicrobiia bacterium]